MNPTNQRILKVLCWRDISRWDVVLALVLDPFDKRIYQLYFSIADCGLRPPASPSCRLYEPEAVGAIGAYAPEGRRESFDSGFWIWD